MKGWLSEDVAVPAAVALAVVVVGGALLRVFGGPSEAALAIVPLALAAAAVVLDRVYLAPRARESDRLGPQRPQPQRPNPIQGETRGG